MSNPYQTPHSAAPGFVSDDAATRVVISGQRLLINSILAYFASLPMLVIANVFIGGTPEAPEVTPIFVIVLLAGLLGLMAAAICACVGIFRMGGVLFPGSTRYLYAIGVLIPAPLIGLIVMLVANSSATGYLKARGINVGFFGAKQPR